MTFKASSAPLVDESYRRSLRHLCHRCSPAKNVPANRRDGFDGRQMAPHGASRCLQCKEPSARVCPASSTGSGYRLPDRWSSTLDFPPGAQNAVACRSSHSGCAGNAGDKRTLSRGQWRLVRSPSAGCSYDPVSGIPMPPVAPRSSAARNGATFVAGRRRSSTPNTPATRASRPLQRDEVRLPRLRRPRLSTMDDERNRQCSLLVNAAFVSNWVERIRSIARGMRPRPNRAFSHFTLSPLLAACVTPPLPFAVCPLTCDKRLSEHCAMADVASTSGTTGFALAPGSFAPRSTACESMPSISRSRLMSACATFRSAPPLPWRRQVLLRRRMRTAQTPPQFSAAFAPPIAARLQFVVSLRSAVRNPFRVPSNVSSLIAGVGAVSVSSVRLPCLCVRYAIPAMSPGVTAVGGASGTAPPAGAWSVSGIIGMLRPWRLRQRKCPSPAYSFPLAAVCRRARPLAGMSQATGYGDAALVTRPLRRLITPDHTVPPGAELRVG